jgi:hypothetical protein
MINERFQVANVVVAGIGWRVIGVSVSPLIECHNPSFGGQCGSERRKGRRLHDVRVRGNQHAAAPTPIQIGKPQSFTAELVPIHVERISYD